MVSLLLAGCANGPPDAAQATTILDCTEPCAELHMRLEAVAERCGLPAETAARACDETNLVRLECQVQCVEEASCELLDGTNTSFTWDQYYPYLTCLRACPGTRGD